MKQTLATQALDTPPRNGFRAIPRRLPPRDVLYRALTGRSAEFDGVFYAAVRTTGIFCRPTCGGKKPKAENVTYYASVGEALHAGYRPCRRCRPLERVPGAPALVRRLLDAVETEPTGRITDKDLERMGIEPSTARRQFLRTYGMTFHAYHRARRMGMALREIREGGQMTEIGEARGYGSESGFREAFWRTFGAPPSKARQAECLLGRWLETPLGPMLALASDAGLCLLEFVDRRGLEREMEGLKRRFPGAIVPGNNAILDKTADQLARYFEGTLTEFDLPLVMQGSEFTTRVWQALRAIPHGETRSYTQIAAQVGRPGASRAVGRANGSNPLGIVVPCHRVVRADGSLCGYGGGVWRKRWLLDHERSPRLL